jgi:hypothetical protein
MSQFLGTPLLSRLDALVSELRTLMRIVSFRVAAFAAKLSSTTPHRKATILRIFMTIDSPQSHLFNTN